MNGTRWAVVAATVFWLSSSSARGDDDAIADARALCDQVIVAWNSHVAANMAALWAKDGDLVDFMGVKSRGSDSVRERLRETHAPGGPFAPLGVLRSGLEARPIAADVVLVDLKLQLTLGGVPTSPIRLVDAAIIVRKVDRASLIAAARFARIPELEPGPRTSQSPPSTLAAQRSRSSDNLRSILLMFVAADIGISKPWPKLAGKRLVLWLVASGMLSSTSAQNLTILFSPADAERSVERAGGPEAYRAVTLASLREGTLDVDRFTSYVGRADAPTAAELERGAAMFADLSFADGALVAFSNGSVKWLTREELGVAPGAPIVAGEGSTSEVLRHLSR